MSTTKTLADKLKAASSVSDLSGKSLLVADSNGSVGKADGNSLFCPFKKVSPRLGNIVRIRNLTSVLISLRGSSGGRYSLVYATGYNPGTLSRVKAKMMFGEAFADWYINGSSDSYASIYVRISGTSDYSDTLTVVSLAGEVPSVEFVSSIPSDATPLVFINS